MNKEDIKSFWLVLGLVILLFVIPYFWRKSRSNDIEKNKNYTIGLITKKSGSLNNGYHWHYEFYFDNKKYEAYRSTHVGYDVKVGDHFLVEFSSKNPGYNKILYEYQLKPDQIEYKNYIGDTIPMSILEYHKKKDRFW